MGLFRLGFIAVYLSDPLISGFTTGAAVLVFTSQIKHILGLKVPRYSGVFATIKVQYIHFKGIYSNYKKFCCSNVISDQNLNSPVGFVVFKGEFGF